MAKITPKFSKVKTHTFNGKKYKIKWKKPRGCEGLCDSPDNPASNRAITIRPDLSAKEISGLILHEGLHAGCFYLDEETVTQVSDDLNELLWKCGFELKKK